MAGAVSEPWLGLSLEAAGTNSTGDDGAECELGNTWGLAVQAMLATIAGLTLLTKRFTERPRRSWVIWFFDSSKQGLGSVAMHFMNLALSAVLIRNSSDKDPCSWYFMLILLDSTTGVGTIYGLLRLTFYIIKRNEISLLYSGQYGTPPRLKAWGAQCGYYLGITVVNKLIVGSLMLAPFWVKLGRLILTLFSFSRDAEATFALLVMPLLLSVFWFWVVDNFIMSEETRHRQRGADASEYQFMAFDSVLDNSDVDSDDELLGL